MLSGASDARARTLATAGMVVTVLLWGTQLPLSQHVLQTMDQYYFGVLRYAIGALLFALTLWWREGAAAFSTEGRGASLLLHGCAGFMVFGLIVSGLVNQPGPHREKALAALQRAFKQAWSPGEPRRMAELLSGLGAITRPLELYLHLPFCDTLCFYCGCNKIITRKPC